MNKFNKGDIVEIRQNLAEFLTIKYIGKVTKVMKNGFYEVSNRNDKKVIGTFKADKLRLR